MTVIGEELSIMRIMSIHPRFVRRFFIGVLTILGAYAMVVGGALLVIAVMTPLEVNWQAFVSVAKKSLPFGAVLGTILLAGRLRRKGRRKPFKQEE
jgi:membrane-bound ClpP family serine protease